MPNPFPGMNPFLEDPAFWQDFHTTFIVCWRDALRAALPRGYEARIGEKVYLIEPPEPDRMAEPDLTVSERASAGHAARATTNPAVVLEPTVMPLILLDKPREVHIEIRRRSDRALVTVVELLSPYNKREPGRSEYLGKRDALLMQEVHVVELDLLRGGRRIPLRGTLPPGDYYAYISRGDDRPNCGVYHWGLRDPLPVIPIPLRRPDPDAATDLAAVFAVAFEKGFYDDSPEFGRHLPVPLREADAAWVAERMRAAGG